MPSIIEKPHIYFWLSIPVIIVLEFFNGHAYFDLNIHDTYFVIDSKAVLFLALIVLFTLGLVYFLISRTELKLFKWFNLLHISITLIGFILLFSRAYNWLFLKSENDFQFYDNDISQSVIIAICLGLIILGQCIFIINVLVAVMRKNLKLS